MVKINIPGILRGCEVGRMQSVGLMQVIPLLSDLEDDRFVSATDARVYTTAYGSLGFKNESPRTLIVPSNAAYIVKQAAQDHAMTRAAVVPGNREHLFKDAMCIQASQGGTISKDVHKLRILPYLLREPAMRMQGKKDYAKLWGNIGSFNQALGAGNASNLETFYRSFARQLEEFVAEFENVPGQVGAIILVGGTVVGIERAPSREFWRRVWKPLIRDCYGSYTLGKGLKTPYRVALKGRTATLEDIERAVRKAEEAQFEAARAQVRELLEDDFNFKSDRESQKLLKGDAKNCEIGSIENDQFLGQLIFEGEKISYASLVAKEVFRDPSRVKWRKSEVFKI